MLFFADIFSFEEIHSEIEKIAIMNELPLNWTYPEIQPRLLEEARQRGFLPKKDEIKWLFFDAYKKPLISITSFSSSFIKRFVISLLFSLAALY